ncbi:Bug family tripartite tricarboxylate transporter substrate binding protein [Pigmentiphaga kullae]|uniref:Tripartite-type tricarboxylate transporter receptor subunit TctC n=1 Tax=Pigmentiphaga kullae TaxID=151784 RepID=A0A4Q7NJ70_9BURK|nr:tripartite tricarboxylate transporter substrate binding protein [Pigmentiphaga kullae]RZS84983.1 tripartite-type tricarboxylate transporter receptor subunit TctC [Pigmentiphaga kullae]
MKARVRHAAAKAMLAAVVLMPAAGMAAPDFPNRPITLIVPGPAGSGTDLIGRLVAEKLGDLMHVNLVVENRAGASGMIGVQQLMRAKPDGYTILLGHNSSNVIVPLVTHPKPYDGVEDFAALGRIGTSSNVLVASASSRYQTLDSLKQAAGRHEPVKYGSPGVGLSQHLDGFALLDELGVPGLHVPYKGSGPALTDLVGGRIDIMFVTPPAVKAALQGGKVRALAQSSAERQRMFQEVPTLSELGYPQLVSRSWWGLFAPKGTPDSVVALFHARLNEMLANKDVQQSLVQMYIEVSPSRSPEAFRQWMQQDVGKWKRVVEAAGVSLKQ